MSEKSKYISVDVNNLAFSASRRQTKESGMETATKITVFAVDGVDAVGALGAMVKQDTLCLRIEETAVQVSNLSYSVSRKVQREGAAAIVAKVTCFAKWGQEAINPLGGMMQEDELVLEMGQGALISNGPDE